MYFLLFFPTKEAHDLVRESLLEEEYDNYVLLILKMILYLKIYSKYPNEHLNIF